MRHLPGIYRKSISHRRDICKTSVGHLADICQASVGNLPGICKSYIRHRRDINQVLESNQKLRESGREKSLDSQRTNISKNIRTHKSINICKRLNQLKGIRGTMRQEREKRKQIGKDRSRWKQARFIFLICLNKTRMLRETRPYTQLWACFQKRTIAF